MTVAPLFSPVASKKQVSCANGKLLMAGVPPLPVAQPIAPPQLPPAARFQYLLAAAVNVMPLLPLQSPNLVPEIGAAAPAIAMSRKSTSVAPAANALTVRVRCVPSVSDARNNRYAAAVPEPKVKVPETVTLPDMETVCMPTLVRFEKDKLLKVVFPAIVVVAPAAGVVML